MKKNRKINSFVYWVVGITIISGLLILDSSRRQMPTRIREKTLALMTGSLGLTILLIVALAAIFGKSNSRKGLMDFFIGDEGTYSLSRLQAVLWAVVIISSQVATMIALLLNDHGNYISYYEAAFAESSVWLLGLSLSSYIFVKGITAKKMTDSPQLWKKKIRCPKWSDILTGSNGLDFSRCQMLVWTIIALLAFFTKCYYFTNYLMVKDYTVVKQLFGHFFEDYASPAADPLHLPYVPYLPWTFVVLMGLSHGVYVGKKLVPDFKLDDVKEGKQNQLTSDAAQLEIKKQLLQQILITTGNNPTSEIDKKNIAALQSSISGLETEIAGIKKDIRDIEQFN